MYFRRHLLFFLHIYILKKTTVRSAYARRIFFECHHRVVKRPRKNVALLHRVIDRLGPHRLFRRLLAPSRSDLDGPHQALRYQQRNVSLEAFLQRSALHGLQQRFQPLDRGVMLCRQRIKFIV